MGRPDYFCCAIPMVNAGIYTCLSEQFILASAAGVLAVATPTIVGSYVPTYTPYIFAGLSFLVAAVQILGFVGVFKERTRLFRTYSWISAVGFACVFATAAALIVVSALSHSKAVTVCQNTYFAYGNSNATNTGSTIAASSSGESKAVCSAFAWADIGIMGGLWIVLLVLQLYMIYMTRSYSVEQKEDHDKYKSIYSQNAEEYAMFERMSRFGPNADAWDHRPSVDSQHGGAAYEYDQVPNQSGDMDKYENGYYPQGGAARSNPFARPDQQEQYQHEQGQYDDAQYHHTVDYADQEATPHPGQYGYEQPQHHQSQQYQGYAR